MINVFNCIWDILCLLRLVYLFVLLSHIAFVNFVRLCSQNIIEYHIWEAWKNVGVLLHRNFGVTRTLRFFKGSFCAEAKGVPPRSSLTQRSIVAWYVLYDF